LLCAGASVEERDRESRPVRRSTLIIGAGGLILLVGAFLTLGPWLEAYRWQASPEAGQAQRNAAAPQLVPVRPTVSATAPVVVVTRPTPVPPSVPALSRPATPAPTRPPLANPPPIVVPTPTLGPAALRLEDVAFQFLDPPQPGATARLSLAIHNSTDAPGGAVSLDLPLAWLDGYHIEGVVPLPIDGTLSGERVENNLRLTVDGPAPGDVLDLAVYVVTTAEVIDAPNLRVLDEQGRDIGRAQPATEAPHAEPGPVYAIDIPSLQLRAGVVQVDWEPPLFVVGQLRSSARVAQGNSVLVGHVRGAAGYNVFDRLDRLSIGERIVASSRGEDYEFVVTDTQVLPREDPSPTLPTDTPRLTLMTCAGDFNPLTGEYPDRLWVIAEPADLVAARSRLQERRMPTAPAQIAPAGGLGNTDTDLARAFGGPVGMSRSNLAVYRRDGIEHQAQLLDTGPGQPRRAAVVVERARSDAPFSMDEALRRAHALLPRDARPRAAAPDGNGRFVVEYFASDALDHALAADLPTGPGEFIIVYARRPDGRVTDILLSIGNDPAAALALLDRGP
jgi:sortase (surface protein transpeptidase)